MPIPCALYIHVPWCVKKCPYCDFNSYTHDGPLPEAAYLEALVADLDAALPLVAERSLPSVFIGGGTPSLLSAAGVRQLLTEIRARAQLAADVEITLEANPGTLSEMLDESRLAGLRAAGVNRLSLGVQSFQDACLAALGRIHDRAAALRAVALAQRHFECVNLDLMYGLPGQRDVAAALADLETALDFAPRHVSCYQLTLEPNTRFAAFPPAGLPDPDLAADMGDAIEARLTAAGYAHYEISAYAKPGGACRHNLNYWRFGDYLGIGAGAHGKLTVSRPGHAPRVLRQARPRHPEAYLRQAGAPFPVFEVLPREVPFEFLMNALRLTSGFSPRLFAARTGQSLADTLPRLRAAERAGLLRVAPTRILPTPRGRRFLNRLLEMLM
ncbi:MAG: radical SAM family heme chaperone HemW [Zoogloeaceae bacterium]|jgi:oxygen-independent coproporphyrinogen-3 oxidase|nr:radical SAM family heme chaperone HemW [Zoogloeaceae bacterium]